jgi:hypothetical protein
MSDMGRGIFEPQEVEALAEVSARLSQQREYWDGRVEPEDLPRFVVSVYQAHRGDKDTLWRHCVEELKRLAPL